MVTIAPALPGAPPSECRASTGNVNTSSQPVAPQAFAILVSRVHSETIRCPFRVSPGGIIAEILSGKRRVAAAREQEKRRSVRSHCSHHSLMVSACARIGSRGYVQAQRIGILRQVVKLTLYIGNETHPVATRAGRSGLSARGVDKCTISASTK